MFKRYRLEWDDGEGRHSIDFFVNSKARRGGFVHRACMLGVPPRLDAMDNNWSEYRANEGKLFEKRIAKVVYCNRTWECYSGQTCLAKLWDQLAKLKFIDMGRISKTNPFKEDDEPAHEDLWEPDELFDRFKRSLT